MLIKDPPVEITDNLLMLGTNEYPLFLFCTEREAAIFEGGTGAMGPLLCEQIRRLGIDKNMVKQLLVSHAHPDHVMAIPLFRETFPGLAVLASAPAVDTLSTEKAISFFCKLDDSLTASLLKAGLIADRHRPQPLAENRIPVDRIIKEGDTIQVGGVRFDVLETPGHSDCSLSFHQPGNRLLLSSDATPYYMPEHDFWWPNYFTGYQAYLDSIRRLAGLDAEILCPGHHGAIKGAEEINAFFQSAIAATREYHQRIIDETTSGRSVRQIAEQLGSEVYQKTPLLPLEFFQKNCALIVKQSLGHEGISVDK